MSLENLCPFTRKGMRSPKFPSVLTDRNRGAWPMWPQGAWEGEPSLGSMAAPTHSGSSQGTRGYGGQVSADVAVPTVLGCDYHFHNLTEEGIKGQASQVISFLKTT